MKVAAVTDSYHPTSDGVVVAVDTYCKALSTVGIESEIVAPDPGDEKDRIDGVHYFRSISFKSYPGYFIPIYPSNKVEVSILLQESLLGEASRVRVIDNQRSSGVTVAGVRINLGSKPRS